MKKWLVFLGIAGMVGALFAAIGCDEPDNGTGDNPPPSSFDRVVLAELVTDAN